MDTDVEKPPFGDGGRRRRDGEDAASGYVGLEENRLASFASELDLGSRKWCAPSKTCCHAAGSGSMRRRRDRPGASTEPAQNEQSHIDDRPECTPECWIANQLAG